MALIPKVIVELVVTGGDVSEPADKQGIGNLMGELLKEGTETRSAAQVAQEAASIGGAISVRVGPDDITVQGQALSDGADALVKLVADVALHPKFPDSELPRLKADLLRHIVIAKSSATGNGSPGVSLKTVYGDNGYGRALPHEPCWRSLTVADVKAFYAKRFVASNARLYITGVFDDGLRKTVELAFSSWPKGQVFENPVKSANKAHTGVGGSARRAPIHDLYGSSGSDTGEQGLHSASGGRLHCGRLVHVANHYQHSRGERLHVFAA